MTTFRFAIRGLESVARSNLQRERSIATGVSDAVLGGAKKIDKLAYKLVTAPFVRYPQFRNVQDAPRRIQLRPQKNWVQVRFDKSKNEASILARAHFTTVTPAVKSVAEKTGQSRILVRRALWVMKGGGAGIHRKVRSHKGHPSRANLRKVSFRRPPGWFVEWSAGKDLDKVQSLRLRGDMLRRVVLQPAVDKHRDEILAAIRKAVERQL